MWDTSLEVQNYWQNEVDGDAQHIGKWLWCKGCLTCPSHSYSCLVFWNILHNNTVSQSSYLISLPNIFYCSDLHVQSVTFHSIFFSHITWLLIHLVIAMCFSLHATPQWNCFWTKCHWFLAHFFSFKNKMIGTAAFRPQEKLSLLHTFEKKINSGGMIFCIHSPQVLCVVGNDIWIIRKFPLLLNSHFPWHSFELSNVTRKTHKDHLIPFKQEWLHSHVCRPWLHGVNLCFDPCSTAFSSGNYCTSNLAHNFPRFFGQIHIYIKSVHINVKFCTILYRVLKQLHKNNPLWKQQIWRNIWRPTITKNVNIHPTAQ
jgi:hypothetical protein